MTKGERFGRLTTVRKMGAYWECLCDCGSTCAVPPNQLEHGRQVSCGCYKSERIAAMSRVHGLSKLPEYRIWQKMVARCHLETDRGYRLYGLRGISVCDRWRTSVVHFIEDMGVRPSTSYSLERVDNDGNYEKSNCIWATQKQQCNNRRGNLLVEIGGRTMTLKQWSEDSGIGYLTLYGRYSRGDTGDALIRPCDPKYRNHR